MANYCFVLYSMHTNIIGANIVISPFLFATLYINDSNVVQFSCLFFFLLCFFFVHDLRATYKCLDTLSMILNALRDSLHEWIIILYEILTIKNKDYSTQCFHSDKWRINTTTFLSKMTINYFYTSNLRIDLRYAYIVRIRINIYRFLSVRTIVDSTDKKNKKA